MTPLVLPFGFLFAVLIVAFPVTAAEAQASPLSPMKAAINSTTNTNATKGVLNCIETEEDPDEELECMERVNSEAKAKSQARHGWPYS